MPAQEIVASMRQACIDIGDQVADKSGFVSIAALLARFQARLICRPLLVEGMIAKVRDERSGDSSSWAVLVDSESYESSEEDIRLETCDRSLPPRMRFTVAHELAHSMAFRPSEFGLHLEISRSEQSGRSAFVEEIERETDKLTTLLLWPEKVLDAFVADHSAPLSAELLSHMARRQGISRHALVNRMGSLKTHDPLSILRGYRLKNVGIGIGEWTRSGEAVLRKWPLFLNFDRNIVPSSLLTVFREDRVPASQVFSDQRLIFSKGKSHVAEFDTTAGTSSSPAAEMLTVQVMIEESSRRPGTSFLYVVKAGAA